MVMITFDTKSKTNPINVHAESKTQRQELSIEKWQWAKYKGTLNITPRFGKTRIGLMAAKLYLNYYKNSRVIIVVPNATLVLHWLDELNAYSPEIYNNVIIVTRLVYNRMDIKGVGLIIYDEIHKYLSSTLTTSAIKSHSTHVSMLGLTGTPPDKKEEYSFLQDFVPIIDTVSEREAITNSWINDYKEFNYGVNFEYNEKINYVKYSKLIAKTLELFNGADKLFNKLTLPNDEYFAFKSSYEVITACLAGKYDVKGGQFVKGLVIRNYLSEAMGWNNRLDLHDTYSAQIDVYWSPSNILNRVKTFIEFVRDRNDLMGSSSGKMSAITEIIRNDMDKPTIIYVHSVAFAEEVTTVLNAIYGNEVAIAYHSKITSRAVIDDTTGEYFTYKSGSKKGLPKIFGKKLLKDKYMQGLNSGKYKYLVTVESLNEGLNVPRLSRVILTAGSLSTVTYKQRKARVFTINPNDLEKESIVINVYIRPFIFEDEQIITRDLTKLLKRQSENEVSVSYVSSPHFDEDLC